MGLEITNFVLKDTKAENHQEVCEELLLGKDARWRNGLQWQIGSAGSKHLAMKDKASVPSKLYNISFDTSFCNECVKAISQSKLSKSYRRGWKESLLQGRSTAFVALLLLLLPNLKELYLGSNHFLHFPILFDLRYVDWITDDDDQRTAELCYKIHQQDPYMVHIFEDVRRRLTTLALPVASTGTISLDPFVTRPALYHMCRLEHLITPAARLGKRTYSNDYPESLTRLTIVDAKEDDHTYKHIQDIIHWRSMRNYLPNLDTIELFYNITRRSPGEKRMINAAAAIGIWLTIHHPDRNDLAAIAASGQIWKHSQDELRSLDMIPADEWDTRQIASHWEPTHQDPVRRHQESNRTSAGKKGRKQKKGGKRFKGYLDEYEDWALD